MSLWLKNIRKYLNLCKNQRPWIRIRISNTDSDPGDPGDKYNAVPVLDPKQWIQGMYRMGLAHRTVGNPAVGKLVRFSLLFTHQ